MRGHLPERTGLLTGRIGLLLGSVGLPPLIDEFRVGDFAERIAAGLDPSGILRGKIRPWLHPCRARFLSG